MLQSREVENSLIGLALSDRDCADRIAELPDDAFFYAETQELHRIIKQMVIDHDTPNVVSVGMRIPEYAAFVTECMQECMRNLVSVTMYKQLEMECMDLRKRRLIQKVCTDVAQKAADPAEDIDNLVGNLTAAANDNGNVPESKPIFDVMKEVLEDLSKPDESIKTGIAGLDGITGGLQNGMLVILGARPKVGKTALGLQIASFVADKTGPVLMVSLEMTPKEIAVRLVAARAEVDMQKLVTKKIGDEDWIGITDSVGELSQERIRFSKARTPLQIRREASNMQRNGGLSLIVVDYIQLLRADESRKSRYEEVSSISRELKLMAMDLDVPILALTQFNRESERDGQRRKPTMSEARDSGSIEQDANLFLIQYPPSEPNVGSPQYEYWAACSSAGAEFQILEVAANRQGPTGNVMLKFDKAHMKFTTLWRD